MSLQLKKLDQITENELSNKTIYCYEKNAEYLSELKDKYSALYAKIVAVIEPNPRYQESVYGLPVVGLDHLGEFDWASSIIVITSDYFAEAFAQLEQYQNILPNTIYYFLNRESETELSYRAKYESAPLKDQIVFRSGPHASSYVRGTDFADNALAVFEYLLQNHINEKYRLIWFVKNPGDFGKINSRYNNVEFVSYDWNENSQPDLREKYYEALFTSKYILFTDAYGFARNCRPDQTRIQLWHGCGFKTRTNFVPCEHRYEYNIVISDLYKRIHADIYGLRDDQVVVTGYPKADWLFQPVGDDKLRELGVKKADKYIFWLPTFRKAKAQLSVLDEKYDDSDTGLPMITRYEELELINEKLVESGIIMVIKLHPFQDESIINVNELTNIKILKNADLVDTGLQINQILGHASALITDYSSVATEYMLLDRPIGFTLDDVDEYKNSRGFVFDNISEYLPGKEIFSTEDFVDFLDEIISGIDSTKDERHGLTKIMHKYVDGESCKRFVEWMLSINQN